MADHKIPIEEKIEKLYKDLKHRKTPHIWEKILAPAVREDEYGTNVKVIEFLKNDRYLPKSVWRKLNTMFGWENNRSALGELFSKNVVDDLCENINKKLPVRIEHLPENLGDKADKYIHTLILAYKYLKAGQIKRAEIMLSTAREMNSKAADLYYMEGLYALKKGDCSKGEAILERLLSVDEENGDAYLALANMYRDQGSYQKAAKYYKNAYYYNCDEKELAAESAAFFIKVEKYTDAMSSCIRFLRKVPYDKDIRQLLSNIASEVIEKYEKEKPALVRDLTHESKKAAAAAYLCMGDTVSAVAVAVPIDKSFYKDEDGCIIAGHLLRAAGRMQEAESAYHKASVLQKKSAKGFYYLGMLRFSEGKLNEAIVSFEKSLSVNIRCFGSYYPLALCYIEKGDLKNAELMADVLVRAQADLASAYTLKGYCLEKRNAPEEALLYYDLAIKTDELMKRPYEYKISLLREMGRDDEADAFEKKTESINFEGPSLLPAPVAVDASAIRRKDIRDEEALRLAASGEAELAKGKMSVAYYDLSSASSIEPNSKYLTFCIGKVLYLMDRYEEALTELEKIEDEPAYRDEIENIKDDITTALGTMTLRDARDKVVLAGYYYNAGKRQACYKLIRSIEDEEELGPGLLLMAGKCCLALSNFEEALNYLQRSLEKSKDDIETMFFIAMTLQAVGRIDEALEMYASAIDMAEKREEFEELYTGKCSLLFGNEQYEDVVSFTDSIKKKIDLTADIKGFTGMAYHRLGQNGKAYEMLAEAAEEGCDTVGVFTSLAEICMMQGKYHEAVIRCDEGLAYSPGHIDLCCAKAGALHGLGRFRQAEYITRNALAADPGSDKANDLMGDMYVDRGMDREACECYGEALEKSRNAEKYCIKIAGCLERIGDAEGASEYYTEALEASPDNKIALLRRAVIYNMADRDEDALKDIKKVLDRDPDDADGLLSLADILSNYEYVEAEEEKIVPVKEAAPGSDQEEPEGSEDRGETGDRDGDPKKQKDIFAEFPEDAEVYYTRAIANRPDFREAYVGRGKYLIQTGKYDGAINDFSKVIELDPESAFGYMQRGIAFRHLGMHELAIEDFAKVIMLNETYVSAYNYMVRSYNDIEQYDTAVKVASAGLNINSGFFYLNANRGAAYYHMKKYNLALEDLERVMVNENRVNTSTVENVLMYRALTFEALGKTKQAAEDYSRLMKFRPDSPEIAKKAKVLGKSAGAQAAKEKKEKKKEKKEKKLRFPGR